MSRVAVLFAASAVVVSTLGLWAEQTDSVPNSSNPPEVSQSVPRLVRFSGTLKDLTGKPLTGPVEIHFSIYKEQADAAPLWQETQTLQLDEQGHYAVLLGGIQPIGLPLELFISGGGHWPGVLDGHESLPSSQEDTLS